MNIVPINNTYNNKNKSDLNFKQIYKIQISHNCPNAETIKSKIYDYFNFQSILSESLENLQQQGLWAKIKSVFEIKKPNFNIASETAFFRAFQFLKKDMGKDPSWLKEHLHLDEPKPIKDGYDTIFVYTADDNLELNKISLKKINQESLEDFYDKCSKGEMKKDDAKYWGKLLYAQKIDEAVNEKLINRPVKEFVINNTEDVKKLTDDLCDSSGFV